MITYKRFFKGFFNILGIFLVTILLHSCQSVDVRGQYISDELISRVNSASLSKEQVVDMLGNPTYTPEYSPNIWYYIQRSQTKRAWLDPKTIDQRIVKVEFDDNDKLLYAKLVENIHKENVSVYSSITPTRGTEQSGIQKFVKNIGRFSTKSDKKKGKGK